MATRTSTKARGGRGTLTASMLGSLPPGDHTDTAVKGLQLRVRQSRDGALTRTWLFRFAWRGEGVRISIGRLPTMTLADARARALELRAALDDGIDPRRARPRRRAAASPLPLSAPLAPVDAHSIEYLVSEFTTHYLRRQRRRPERAEGILRREALASWAGRDARTITPREVVDLLNGMVAAGRPTSANHAARLLSLMFRFGVQQHIVDGNPVQILMPPGGKERARTRTLSDDELRAFLSDPFACAYTQGGHVESAARLAHALTVMLLTGQRRGELCKARWQHVDLTGHIWTIPEGDSKNEHRHLVPLSAWAVEEFRWLKNAAQGASWVLPTPPGKTASRDGHINDNAIGEGLREALPQFRARGVAPFRTHDLRRTVRTNLSRLKIPPHIAERVINHKQPGPYDLWAYIDEKREALDKWAAHLEALKAAGPPTK